MWLHINILHIGLKVCNFSLYAPTVESCSHNGLPAVIYSTENEWWKEHHIQALKDESGKVRKWAGKFRIVSYYDDAHFL